MALDPTIMNALLQSQLAMHAVNNPAGVASLAASLGAQPPLPPVPTTQVASADPQIAMAMPTPAPPAPATPTTAQAAAPVAPATTPAAAGVTPSPSPANLAAAGANIGNAAAGVAGGVTPEDYTPPEALGPVTPADYTPDGATTDKTMKEKMAQFAKVLGAVAPPSEPAAPPMVHSSLPPQGSYNPQVVAEFLAALQGAQGGGGQGGGGLGSVASLGKLIGG
jgi:hypothetical protein